MEDDWIFLGDGTGSGSDSASASASDDDSGFTIVRRGRKGGDQCSDDAPATPRVAAMAVPQPMPPGLSLKVVSYDEAFASSSSEDGGGRDQPGCNDEATARGAIAIQGAGIDDAAGTGSGTEDCTVTCKEGCESDQVGEHDGTGSSAEAHSAPSIAVAAAPTGNCPETTAPVSHGEAHSELASGVDQGGAEEVEDEDSESCEDDDTENTDSSSEDEDEDTFISSSDEEDEDTFSSRDEEYKESFSEKEYTAEIFREEEDDDDDAESSGEEKEEDGSESCGEMDYVEISGEESHDADNTGEEQEQEEEHDDAECSGEVDDVESTGDEDAECAGEEEGDDDLEISGEKKVESDEECSGEEDDVESSGDESDDPESSGADSDDDAESYGEEEDEEEEEEVVDAAENGKQDIFAMLFPRATTACDASAEQAAANVNGAVKERSESFPSKYDDMDTDSSGSDMDTDSSDMEDDDCLESDEEDDIADVAENGNQDIFAMLFPKAKACDANMDDYEDESEHRNIDNYEAESEHGYIDYEEEVEEEDGSLFDMLLPRDHAINDDIDTHSSDMEDNCLESDEEDDIVNVAENGNQDIFAMLRATACHANIDDYEDESEHGSIDDDVEEEEELEDGSLFEMRPRDCTIDKDIDSSDGEDEAANTATAACGCSAEPSHGTRRPVFAGRAARGYDDVDTDSDMEEGDDEVVAADVNGTSLYGWPRATAGGGVQSQRWGFASQSQTERQALWEDLRRQLAAEAFDSSGQQLRSYDDVDDTCDVPVTAAPAPAPGGYPAGSCARTPEAQFTARELAMEETRRRKAAQLELDRALARQAALAAQASESALADCATAERQATGDVTRSAVAKRDVPADFTFIIGVYVFVFLVVSLLSLALPSN